MTQAYEEAIREISDFLLDNQYVGDEPAWNCDDGDSPERLWITLYDNMLITLTIDDEDFDWCIDFSLSNNEEPPIFAQGSLSDLESLKKAIIDCAVHKKYRSRDGIPF
jgi:hypothetical protein